MCRLSVAREYRWDAHRQTRHVASPYRLGGDALSWGWTLSIATCGSCPGQHVWRTPVGNQPGTNVCCMGLIFHHDMLTLGSSRLYGLSVHQTYRYFLMYKRDIMLLKVLVRAHNSESDRTFSDSSCGETGHRPVVGVSYLHPEFS